MVDEQISGAMVHSHIAALRVRIPTYEVAFNRLSRQDQEDLRLVTPLSWVSIQALERLYVELAAEGGITVPDLHTQIASEVVGKTITTIWRAILRFATDEVLMGRAPTIFKRAYRQGRVTVARSGAGFGELEVTEWPDISEFALRGMRVGIESTLRAAGRKNPRGTPKRTRDGAVLRFEWDV
jgi:hypothetical protein